jgi:hypothetical protein
MDADLDASSTEDSGISAYAAGHAWAEHWAQRWFLDPAGQDAFRGLGVDGGWVTHVDAFERLLKFALQALAVSDAAVSRSILSALKARGLDRTLRGTGLRILMGRPAAPTPASVALIVETPTPSMFEPPARVAHALGREARIAVADPRVYRRFRKGGFHPHALVVDRRTQRNLIRRGRALVETAWRSLIEANTPMPLAGLDRGPDARQALRSLTTASMPWLMPEREAVSRFLAAVGAHTVAVASDQHRIGRVTTAVAHDHSARVVVLQHGLPQNRVGFLPVVADSVAAWSDASRAWYVAHGTPSERIEVLGNPRLDPSMPEPVDVPQLTATTRLLVPLSPTDVEINRRLITAVLDAALQLPDAAIAIKLHPGDGHWSFVRDIVRRHAMRDRVRVYRREPLRPLLQWATGTVLHRSTVVLESLAAGTPVIVWSHSTSGDSASADLAGLRIPVVADVAGLVAAVHGLDVTGTDRAALERIVGPLDGASAARIARYLLESPPEGR